MGQRGFTLLEMVIVIIILGMAAGIIVSRGALHSDRLALAGSARTLAEALRLARAQAIVEGQPVAVTILGGAFAIGQDAPRRLPAGQAMPRSRIVFTADGQASDATVVIASAAGQVPVRVNWLTGLAAVGAYQPAAR